MVKLDILINGERVDALSLMVHRENATYRGRDLVSRMRELIPRQMVDVAVQAAIGSHRNARETVKALRKNGLAKGYGRPLTPQRKIPGQPKTGEQHIKQDGAGED